MKEEAAEQKVAEKARKAALIQTEKNSSWKGKVFSSFCILFCF